MPSRVGLDPFLAHGGLQRFSHVGTSLSCPKKEEEVKEEEVKEEEERKKVVASLPRCNNNAIYSTFIRWNTEREAST